MRIIEAYHCDYCKKYSKSKGVITRHEKECYHNPVTKACATCKFLSQVNVKGIDDDFGIEVNSVRPICLKGIKVSISGEEFIGGYAVRLKNHCEAWEKDKEEEECI